MKTEGKQIHFLGDVLVTVASLDLKVPINISNVQRTLKYIDRRNSNS